MDPILDPYGIFNRLSSILDNREHMSALNDDALHGFPASLEWGHWLIMMITLKAMMMMKTTAAITRKIMIRILSVLMMKIRMKIIFRNITVSQTKTTVTKHDKHSDSRMKSIKDASTLGIYIERGIQ